MIIFLLTQPLKNIYARVSRYFCYLLAVKVTDLVSLTCLLLKSSKCGTENSVGPAQTRRLSWVYTFICGKLGQVASELHVILPQAHVDIFKSLLYY